MPTSKELARDAKEFVSSNRSWMWEYIKPLLPYLVVCGLISEVGRIYYSDLFSLAGIASAYLMACFALSWHRAVLLGPKEEHKVNPFSIESKYRPFLVAFFLVAVVPVLFGVLGGLIVGVAIGMANKGVGGNGIVLLSGLFLMGSVVFGTIKAMRLSFLLPARAVGVKISSKGATKVSRGLLWLFFVASFRVSLGPICLGILSFIVILIVLMMAFPSEGFEQNKSAQLTASLLFFFPVLWLQVIMAARYVTVLSYLYQWSVQNRFKKSSSGKVPVVSSDAFAS